MVGDRRRKAEVTQAVRGAVVGGGAFGKLHALTLLRLGEAHLAGIVGRTEKTLAKIRLLGQVVDEA
jgi:hypothetical protein